MTRQEREALAAEYGYEVHRGYGDEYVRGDYHVWRLPRKWRTSRRRDGHWYGHKDFKDTEPGAERESLILAMQHGRTLTQSGAKHVEENQGRTT